MEYKEVAGGICAPKTFAAVGVCAASGPIIPKNTWHLILVHVRCAAAGVYTTNKSAAHRCRPKPTWRTATPILVNSGNANTCQPPTAAEDSAAPWRARRWTFLAEAPPASTGVIGQPMARAPFSHGIPAAAAKLAATAQGSADCDRHHDHHTTKKSTLWSSPWAKDVHPAHWQGTIIRPQHGHHAGLLYHRCRHLPCRCCKKPCCRTVPAP